MPVSRSAEASKSDKTHDVFVCYSSDDKHIADAACRWLESNGLRCWIAPRDILPGINYAESITEAVRGCRVLVLIFSSSANKSPHVIHELTDAFSNGIHIIPFRIEDVPLSKSMEYLISVPHWLDAMTPPLDKHLEELTGRIQSFIKRNIEEAITYPSNSLKDNKKDTVQERKDKNVQFTVYRPGTVVPERWYPVLVFAHLTKKRPDAPVSEPDPIKEVERRAEQALGPSIKEYGKLSSDSPQPVPHRSEITFVPVVEGIEFNPPSRSFLWIESVHKEEFQICASQELDGKTASGKMMVFLGKLAIAEITMNIEVNSKYAPENAETPLITPAIDVSHPFRKIFASYSHKDKEIVAEIKDAAKAIGDEYLCDVIHIRPGEVWNAKIQEMIRDAQIFQLFWSWNSMDSAYVRQEYEYALSLNRPFFVRPTYWEDPFPEKRGDGQPPECLQHLQFMRITPKAYDEKGRKAPEVRNIPVCPNVDYEQIQNDLTTRYPVDYGSIPYQYTIIDSTSGTLLQQAETLSNKGDFPAAESMLRKAIDDAEKAENPDPLNMATALNNLAALRYNAGDYAEAEHLYRRALAIREKFLGPEHPETVLSLENLASLLNSRGDYAGTETMYRRVLSIKEKILGPEHPDKASSLENLANLLGQKGDNNEAELLYRRALAIREKTQGPEHPDMARSLIKLALILINKGGYGEAESLIMRSLTIDEKVLGLEHPNVATDLNHLADVVRYNHERSDVEPLLRRALAIDEKVLGPDHPNTVIDLMKIGHEIKLRGNLDAAEPILKEAFIKGEKVLGAGHPAMKQLTDDLKAIENNKKPNGTHLSLETDITTLAGGGSSNRPDVFICHTHRDENIANAIYEILEQKGLKCFSETRDIYYGSHWDTPIEDAISGSKMLILILSSHANDSKAIESELSIAVSRGIKIIPVLIDNFTPSKTMEYYISNINWIDAKNLPLEGILKKVSEALYPSEVRHGSEDKDNVVSKEAEKNSSPPIDDQIITGNNEVQDPLNETSKINPREDRPNSQQPVGGYDLSYSGGGYAAPTPMGRQSLLAKIIGILIFIVITLVILAIVLSIIWGIYSIIF